MWSSHEVVEINFKVHEIQVQFYVQCSVDDHAESIVGGFHSPPARYFNGPFTNCYLIFKCFRFAQWEGEGTKNNLR